MEIIHKKNRENTKMRRKEYLEELKEHLMGLEEADKKEIIEDYEEHFKIGKKMKRKDSEIAASLGSPKKLAREIRKELKNKENVDFESSMVELWVEVKTSFKNAFKLIEKEVPIIRKKTGSFLKKIKNKNFNSPKNILEILGIIFCIYLASIILAPVLFVLAIVLAIIIGIKHFKKKDKKAEKKKSKVSGWKITMLILLDLFFMIWFLPSIFAIIISLFASGFAITISGLVAVVVSVFAMLIPTGYSIINILLSGVFAGIGVFCLGILFSMMSWKLGKYFLKGVIKYLKFHGRIFTGRKQ